MYRRSLGFASDSLINQEWEREERKKVGCKQQHRHNALNFLSCQRAIFSLRFSGVPTRAALPPPATGRYLADRDIRLQIAGLPFDRDQFLHPFRIDADPVSC